MMEEALHIPNITSPESPVGDESQCKEIFKYGIPRIFDFKPKSHIQLAEALDLVDFDNAVKVSGSKFVYLKNELVLLEQALIGFAFSKLRKYGFTLISTPDLVKNEVIEGCGFNPRDKKKSQIYSIDDGELSLIGTSEISIMGILANEILNKKDLPIKYAGLSHCFRREAGRGKESKGLYRLHQFTKVEMFSFTEGSLIDSEKAQLEIVEIQKEIYGELGLCFRVLEMSTEELGSSAYRKFDIEAYFPSLNGFGEISSCSNCTDFQSKRLASQYWDSPEILDEKKRKQGLQSKSYLHSVNGTALAVPRILMAILEYFQNDQGGIEIPACLLPHMTGITKIEKRSPPKF